MNYVTWVLTCHGCKKPIRIPRPSLTGTIDNPLEMPKTDVRANFVCPECGLVSAYSHEDCDRSIGPTQDPFEQGLWSLVSIEVECDGKNCEAPKAIHTTSDNVSGTYKPEKTMGQWKADETALCGSDHHLKWRSDLRLYKAVPRHCPL
jgi:hypothetical protein